MKKKLLLIALITSGTVALNATIWRINNMPGTTADFTTLQSAHNAAYVYNGDTLHLEASSASYGDLTATKKLVIIGNGYFLAENPLTQANLNGSIVNNVVFNAGSDGSIIAGCTAIGRITVNASNLIIEHCYIEQKSSSSAIWFRGNTNNVTVRQNYIINSNESTSSWIDWWAILCDGSANNVVIKGNFIKALISTSTSNERNAIQVLSNFSGIISNNVIDGKIQVNNTEFYNNIQFAGLFSQTNCIVKNNIGNSTQFGTTNGNQQNVLMTNVFIPSAGTSTDGKWKLKTGSPALGAGFDGYDCGMFSGEYPYILSGIPSIPSIYFHVQTIDNVNQTLQITVKTKSNQ